MAIENETNTPSVITTAAATSNSSTTTQVSTFRRPTSSSPIPSSSAAFGCSANPSKGSSPNPTGPQTYAAAAAGSPRLGPAYNHSLGQLSQQPAFSATRSGSLVGGPSPLLSSALCNPSDTSSTRLNTAEVTQTPWMSNVPVYDPDTAFVGTVATTSAVVDTTSCNSEEPSILSMPSDFSGDNSAAKSASTSYEQDKSTDDWTDDGRKFNMRVSLPTPEQRNAAVTIHSRHHEAQSNKPMLAALQPSITSPPRHPSKSLPSSRRNSIAQDMSDDEFAELSAQQQALLLAQQENLGDHEDATETSSLGHPHDLDSLSAISSSRLVRLIRQDSGTSPGIPPQFDPNFMMEDTEEVAPSAQVPTNFKRYINNITTDQSQFPVLLHRDNVTTLSVASAALDLAPLAQTRRGSRPSLWDTHIPPGGISSTQRAPGGRSLGSTSPFIVESPYTGPSSNGEAYDAAMFNHMGRYGGAFSRPLLSSAFGSSVDDVYFNRSERAPTMSSSNSGTGGRNSPSAQLLMQDDWPATTSHDESAFTSRRSGGLTPSEWDTSQYSAVENGNLQRLPNGQFVCRFFRQGYCSRGDRCKFPHVAMNGPPVMGSARQISGMDTTNGILNGSMMSSLTLSGPGSRSSVLSGGNGSHPAMIPAGPGGAPTMVGANANGAAVLSNGPTVSGGPKSSNGAVKGHKRNASSTDGPRFPPLEQLRGQIYTLCKDQHGCRYLQKRLEENNEAYVNIIFDEAYEYMAELMSDPFGNYLCQKLFGYCSEEQKTRIANKVSGSLVNVSLNMHGTRSVQKLIDCLSLDEQIAVIVDALRGHVVTLIKDLNGNHVIQKCLNKLTAEQNQFIYDAVTENCVAVASHRHGCCVLQRCIDHASEAQKIQLAAEITYHALTLVQDAFGNYVVQYVLDLKYPRFSDAIIRRFLGNVFELSLQKFSSNVIEKCIRLAEPDTRRGLIAGLLDKDRLPILLQDSYANYVVQTSLDVAEPFQYLQLVEMIRPMLPSIRHLPYCKRIQSKLMRDISGSGLGNGLSATHNGTHGNHHHHNHGHQHPQHVHQVQQQQQQQQHQQAHMHYGMSANGYHSHGHVMNTPPYHGHAPYHHPASQQTLAHQLAVQWNHQQQQQQHQHQQQQQQHQQQQQQQREQQMRLATLFGADAQMMNTHAMMLGSPYRGQNDYSHYQM